MKGVTFPKVQPNVTIKFFADDVIVTKMYAQVDYPKYPSNIQQICVTLYNRSSTPLTYPNGSIVPMLISPLNNAMIEGWFEGVKMIRVRLCNTTDGKPPRNFRFAVVGCYASRATFILNQFTAYSQQSTTSITPNPNNTVERKRKKRILLIKKTNI
jgi:hypothetical protein